MNVRQLRERLGGVDGDLEVNIILNDKAVDVDSAYYSLGYGSFILNVNGD